VPGRGGSDPHFQRRLPTKFPKPTHHDLAACCFLARPAPGSRLRPAATIEPVTFERLVVDFKHPLLDDVPNFLPSNGSRLAVHR